LSAACAYGVNNGITLSLGLNRIPPPTKSRRQRPAKNAAEKTEHSRSPLLPLADKAQGSSAHVKQGIHSKPALLKVFSQGEQCVAG